MGNKLEESANIQYFDNLTEKPVGDFEFFAGKGILVAGREGFAITFF